MCFYRHICNKLSSLNTYKTNLKKAYKYFYTYPKEVNA